MAKKTAKKSARKTAKKAAKKVLKAPSKKAAAKKSPAKSRPTKTISKMDPTAPVPVSTGSGSSVGEVGASLVALFNAGKFGDVERTWWSPSIVSCEGAGVNSEWRGRKAAEAKNAWWYGENEMIGASAEGPYLGASGFAVKFRMEYKVRASGEIKNMTEVGVYTVNKGKIVREEFMYGA